MMFAVPQGSFELRRVPDEANSPLRAWDAADELVLRHIDHVRPPAGRWLVVNDLFGALAVALHPVHPQSWGDSVTSHVATIANLERNGLRPDSFVPVPSSGVPDGPIDVVVIKIPRSLALLEDQLARLRPLLGERAVVVGTGMVKLIHNSTLELFERYLGPAPTSRATKKARLIHATIDPDLDPPASPYPTTWHLDPDHRLIDHANVFSRGRLDQGTRVLLEHLPRVDRGAHVLDLGCGNGILGLSIAEQSSLTRLSMVDESYHAVASARENAEQWRQLASDDGVVVCHAAHDLSGFETASVDLVVNNPPFHAHQSRSDVTARAMFADAHRVLRPGGRLLVVANRHLDYQQRLARRFGRCQVVASTPKFVVLEAQRSI